ncbi:MAG: DUF523 domain-containing protein [bacterium]
MILVSACLLGTNCRYDGGNCLNNRIKETLKNYEYKAICPELAGNLSIPRSPAEIKGGSGESVLEGKSRVITKDGVDLTKNFLCGARKAIQGIEIDDIDFAILKERSTSCGVKEIYNGEFTGSLQKGSGVSTAYFISKDIIVFSEEEVDKKREKLIELD